MERAESLLSSKKYLSWAALALFTIMVLLSPRAYAADSGAAACSTSMPPTPYTNGAPVVRTFYPADGSTITITRTGAVIKQSPCQTPYREGWVNPADICNLNQFSQLSGLINQSDANPNAGAAPVSTCNPAPPAMNPTPMPTPQPVTPPVHTANVTVIQTVGTPPAPASNPPAPVTPSSTPVVESTTTTTPATALPDTGSGGVMALGGISAVLGTAGHFFYRRRASS